MKEYPTVNNWNEFAVLMFERMDKNTDAILDISKRIRCIEDKVLVIEIVDSSKRLDELEKKVLTIETTKTSSSNTLTTVGVIMLNVVTLLVAILALLT